MKKALSAILCVAGLTGAAWTPVRAGAHAPRLRVHLCPAATARPDSCNKRLLVLTFGERAVQPGVYAPFGSLYDAMLEVSKPAAQPLTYLWMSLYRGSDLVGAYRVPVEQDGHPLVAHLLLTTLSAYGYCSGGCPGVYSHTLGVAPHIQSGRYTLRILGQPAIRFALRHVS